MSAAKKTILLLWLVIVASLGNASALTPGTTETCVGEKSLATVETRQAGPLQTAGTHQENGSRSYEVAPDSLLAFDGAGSTFKITTDPGALVPNITTDATAAEARSALENSGYTGATSADGQASIYTNSAGNTYIIRPSNSAPGGSAVDYYPSGSNAPTLKINLGK